MLVSSINDRNVVDDSVKEIIKIVPSIVRRCYGIFEKYGKLIVQKYDQLKNSDEQRRIKNVSKIDNFTLLTFDKMLFALDRDLYIDFMNEIKQINGECVYFDNYPNNTDLLDKDANDIKLSSLSLMYLVHPSIPLKRLSMCTYEIESSTPLIKIEPRFLLERVNDSWSTIPFNNIYNEEASNFGVGINTNSCDGYIDITSLFEIFRANFAKNSKNYSNGDETSDYDISLKRELDLINLTIFDKKILDLISENIIESITNRIIYSTTITYLATIGKINKDYSEKGIVSIFSEILNSCRKSVLGEYDAAGYELKTGMTLRHMTVDISTIFNAISRPEAYSNGLYNEQNVLKRMIEYAFSIKYCTFNYIQTTVDNLKHKKLLSILAMAKPQVCFLNSDTRSELQCITPKNNTCFCPKTDIRIDGTFAYLKRIYDTTIDFIDAYAKILVLKKRMKDAGGLNFSDGTVDQIGKRAIDYRSYLKQSYEELKMSLSNIYNRIKSVVIGKRYFTNNIMVKDDNNEIIRNLNTIIYGINSESVLDEDFYTSDIILDESVFKQAGYDSKGDNYFGRTNLRISNIRNIYNVLKERECTYSHNSQDLLTAVNSFGNGSLVSFWISITECISDFFDTPFKVLNGIMNKISIQIEDQSINGMAYKGELYEENLNSNFINSLESLEQNKFISIEDLKERVQNFKEKIDENDSESVFGGLLFGDFGGIPLAQDITAKEAEIYNDQLSAKTVPNEEIESFESLKADFDKIIAKYF